MAFTFLMSLSEEEFDEKIKRCVKEALAASNPNVPVEDEQDRILSVTEAASLLNLAKQTIYGFTSTNAIPFFKKGKKLYFKKSELKEWLLESRHKTIDELKTEYNNKRKA